MQLLSGDSERAREGPAPGCCSLGRCGRGEAWGAQRKGQKGSQGQVPHHPAWQVSAAVTQLAIRRRMAKGTWGQERVPRSVEVII